MAYDLDERLVVGVASSALFDLTEADAVFRHDGEEVYRRYQEDHLGDPLAPGVAFSFIRRLLLLNDLSAPTDPLVEVIVLSRNDPDTGLRVMRSIAHHGLPMSRAIFRQGRASYDFMPAMNMCLFLSANEADVRSAAEAGHPAGQVLASAAADDGTNELRIAFDFDGVLAGDEAEAVFQAGGLEAFHEHEASNPDPLPEGPLLKFLAGVNRIQRLEEAQRVADPDYELRLRVSIVTARDAPATERAVMSLKAWGATVNDAFFLGGVEKKAVIEVLRPQIFFDDQRLHLDPLATSTPSVHIPWGIANVARAATAGGKAAAGPSKAPAKKAPAKKAPAKR